MLPIPDTGPDDFMSEKDLAGGERIENNKRQSNMDIRNLLGRLSFLRIRLFHFRLFGKHRTGIFYDKGLSPSDGKQD